MIAINECVKSSEGKTCFPKCNKCGSDTFCKHSIGSSGCDPVDDFRLICPNCGQIDMWCHVDMGNDAETCPWCGKLA